MASLIIKIQNEANDSSVGTTTLLRSARTAAFKLDQTDFLHWIDDELNGYDAYERLPKYRKISGPPMAQHPHKGWIPVIMRNVESAKAISKAGLFEPIGEIEHALKNMGENDTFMWLYGPDMQEVLRKACNQQTVFGVRIETSQYAQALESIRNIVLSWALSLEKNGILGEGFHFEKNDSQKASPVTQNIFANNIGIIGSIGDNNYISQNQNNQADIIDAVKLIEKFSGEFPADIQSEIERQVSIIIESVKNPSTKNNSGKSAAERLIKIGEAAASSAAGHLLIQTAQRIFDLFN
jgi:hypothetical protein